MSQLSAYLSDLQRFGIVPGLQRIEDLLARTNNPHLQYPHILIGGTNGKGSTAEFTARTLAQNGRRVGLYTSPHLYNWNERIRILPGEGLFEGAISDADLDQLLKDALPHIAATAAELGQPTEFEVMTFLGLWHFARCRVDAAVLEVGLGGKWDATNITSPQVSAVTHVALDHMDRLGNTLEEIAADKVCIARAGKTLFTVETKQNVLEIFETHCHNNGVHLVKIETPESDDFQQMNRALALEIAREFSGGLGWETPTQIVSAQVPGRAEIIGENPRVIIDGANNPDGAARLARHLREELGLQPEKTILVVGILADKDWRAMLKTLVPIAHQIICTQSDSPRALPVNELASEAQKFSSNVETCENIRAAVAQARAVAGSDDTILVTGSFTLIAEVARS